MEQKESRKERIKKNIAGNLAGNLARTRTEKQEGNRIVGKKESISNMNDLRAQPKWKIRAIRRESRKMGKKWRVE